MDYEELLNRMPNGYNDFEKARWLYIELGKYFVYDEKYIVSDSMEEKRKMLDYGIDDIHDNNAICTSIARIYTELLKKVGIKAKTVIVPLGFPKIEHGFTEIEIDGKAYLADLEGDLINIKKGYRTTGFMIEDPKSVKDYDAIDGKKLELIDDKIGYTIQSEGELKYTNQIIQQLKKEFELLDIDNIQDSSLIKESIETRREMGIEDLHGKDLLDYEINILMKYMKGDSFKGWDAKDKGEYFTKLIRTTLNPSEIRKHYRFSSIACVNPDKTISKFTVFDSNDDAKNIIMFNHNEIEYVSPKQVKKLFDAGMKTLSKENSEEFYTILTSEKGNIQEQDKESQPTTSIKALVKNALARGTTRSDVNKLDSKLEEKTKSSGKEEVTKDE